MAGTDFHIKAGQDNPVGGKMSQEQAKQSDTHPLPLSGAPPKHQAKLQHVSSLDYRILKGGFKKHCPPKTAMHQCCLPPNTSLVCLLETTLKKIFLPQPDQYITGFTTPALCFK